MMSKWILQVMYSDFFEALKAPEAPVAAHLDTVFPEGPTSRSDTRTVRLCPGIGDNSRGLAALLSVIRAFRHTRVKPVGM